MTQDVMRRAMKVRLAQSPDEVRVAQQLRYHVFHEELGANLGAETELDEDRFDLVSHHLLVVDEGSSAPEHPLHDGNLVGTYRLITQDQAARLEGFYSAAEFDLAPLLARIPELTFLELGRSCVLKRCRNAAVLELLWQGIWDFVRNHRIDVLIGCASFPGSDPARHAQALNFLFTQHPATGPWHARARLEQIATISPASHTRASDAAILRDLPPLVKGYLRLGAMFGQGAVIDHAFNTVDVLVVLPVARINPRFFGRFGAPPGLEPSTAKRHLA